MFLKLKYCFLRLFIGMRRVEIIEIPPSFSFSADLERGDEDWVDPDPESASVEPLILDALTVSRRPTVFRGFDLGPARQLWSPEYLKAASQGKTVKVQLALAALHRTISIQLTWSGFGIRARDKSMACSVGLNQRVRTKIL